MADRGDTHYRVSTLNLWFAVSSALMLLATVWTMYDDWNAPWKPYQREWRDIDLALTQNQLESMADEQANEIALVEQLEAVREANASKGQELAEAEESLYVLEEELTEIDRQVKIRKGVLGWEVYEADEFGIHQDQYDERAHNEQVYEFLVDLRFWEYEYEKQLALVQEQQGIVNRLTSEIAEAERAVKDAGKELDLLRNKIDAMAPEDAPAQLANIIRDFPGLDFVDPNLKVRKVVSPHIKLDLNFNKKPRIDMCATCHAGIDSERFTEENLRAGGIDEELIAHPYLAHPRLDLFLSAKSPHPMVEVGCTVCHGGSGEALDFQRADHRPRDEAQEEEWYEEYHAKKQKYWDWPMYKTQQVEAGCVQCHTTSMELIAEDAPKVSKGYQLFEEYGCYSCHKVEWFPTKRKRGPSLAHMNAKLSSDWVSAWVANPKAFRPDTRMPQIFHLDNFKPDQLIAKSNYGEGRDILGQEWNDNAVAAVTAYLVDGSNQMEFEEIPVEGDAIRGREVFRLSGCLACHNTAPYEGEPSPLDLAEHKKGTNEMGPNLRGVATKLSSPEWLYAWIKDPKQYWPDTRMPDLRLPEQDMADIVAYMWDDPDGIFHDVPEGWAEEASPYDREVLAEQARWFYARDGRETLEQRLETGEWTDDQALLVAVGEKFVLNQGCFSCHDINGMEAAMPIGVELTQWGSKTVDKLDFGFLPQILADQENWHAGGENFVFRKKKQLKSYREGWIEQKLHNPRIYDEMKYKNPTDRLRMPYFGFTDEEVEAISTFVIGLVNDDVGAAKMTPTAEQASMDAGMRAVRQNNCEACHVIDPGEITFTGEDGERHTVQGFLSALDEEVMPPPMDDFHDYLADYVEYWREDDDEFDVETVWATLLEPHPDFGDAGTAVEMPVEGLEVKPPKGGTFVATVSDYYLRGLGDYDENDEWVFHMPDPDGEGKVEDVTGEFAAHYNEDYSKIRWTFAPPVLLNEGHKVQRDWFYSFLQDPMPLREQMRVKMPTFSWDPGEAAAVADYFAYKSHEEWPARYARKLRLQLGLSASEMAADAEEYKLTAEVIRAIEDGLKPETEANLAKLLAYGASKGYGTSHSVNPTNPHPSLADSDEPTWSPAPAVDPKREMSPRRAPTYLDSRLEEIPNLYTLAEELARGGPNCFQCHFYNGVPPLDGAAQPIAWAPDLFQVKDRLREDWVHEWVKNPLLIYPGTAMPANFSATPPANQEFFPDSNNEEQIQLIMDWLFNMDRAAFRN